MGLLKSANSFMLLGTCSPAPLHCRQPLSWGPRERRRQSRACLATVLQKRPLIRGLVGAEPRALLRSRL